MEAIARLHHGTMAAELINPDAVYCVGVTHNEILCALSVMERNPIRFDEPDWLDANLVAAEILALLPRGEVALDAGDIAELESYFGPVGLFPAERFS
jgi:hypothetical protein